MAEYRAVIEHIVHDVVAGHVLVLAKGHQQVGKGLLRNVTGAYGFSQRDKDRMARLAPVAGVEFPAPQIQQRERLLAIPYLIAQVIRDAAVGIDAVEVRPQPGRQKPRGHMEILVVGGGQALAVGARLFKRRALLGNAVLRRQRGPSALY